MSKGSWLFIKRTAFIPFLHFSGWELSTTLAGCPSIVPLLTSCSITSTTHRVSSPLNAPLRCCWLRKKQTFGFWQFSTFIFDQLASITLRLLYRYYYNWGSLAIHLTSKLAFRVFTEPLSDAGIPLINAFSNSWRKNSLQGFCVEYYLLWIFDLTLYRLM